MKFTLIAIGLMLTIPTYGHELDNDTHEATYGTTVVRRSKTDPKDVAVAYSKKRLQPGEKLSPQAFDSTNELDRTSSTSSWMFENPWATAGAPPYGSSYSYGGGYADNYGVEGEGYGNQAYNPWYQPYNGGWNNWAPYFQYQDPNYGYSYWGW